MTTHAWILLVLYLAVLLLTVKPMGIYLAKVMAGEFAFVTKTERPLYRLCGIRADEEMGWLKYAFAIVLFNAFGVLAVYALQRLQAWLPLNPEGMANVSPDSAFNTAVSDPKCAINALATGLVSPSRMAANSKNSSSS